MNPTNWFQRHIVLSMFLVWIAFRLAVTSADAGGWYNALALMLLFAGNSVMSRMVSGVSKPRGPWSIR